MPYIGQTDTIKIQIGVEDVLSAMGAVSVTEVTFTAMVTYAKSLIAKRAVTSAGNLPVFIGFTILGIATTVAQEMFKKEISNLADLHIDINIEYKKVEYTQQGATVLVPSWVTTGYNVYIK